MSSTENFTLKTDSQDFASRLNSVFSEISSLEQDHESWHRNQDSRQNERFWKPEPGEEGSYSLDATFKRPRGFPMKRRLPTLDYVPNFNRNPTKWTKYSLADVPELSERSNARAALSFLEDRKRQKLEAAELEKEALTTAKIIFHKPKTGIANEQTADADGATDEDPPPISSTMAKSKFVMPECVVGVKDTRVATSKRIKDRLASYTTSVSSSIHLQHLDDEENNTCEETEKETTRLEKTDASSHSGFHKFTKKTVRQLKVKKLDMAEGEDANTGTGTMDCE